MAEAGGSAGGLSRPDEGRGGSGAAGIGDLQRELTGGRRLFHPTSRLSIL